MLVVVSLYTASTAPDDLVCDMLDPGVALRVQILQFEVHPRLIDIHIATGHQRSKLREHDAAQYVERRVRPH